MLALASVAIASPIEQRAAQVSTKTVKTIITSTTIVPVPTTISQGIDATGVSTIIPGALTMTFLQAPAYLYLETFVDSTSLVTVTSTTKVKVTITPSTTSSTSSTKSASTVKSSSTVKTTNTRTVTMATSTATASSFPESLLGPFIDHWDGTTFYQSPGPDCLFQADPSGMTGDTFQTIDNPTCQTDCQTSSQCHSYSWEPSTLTCTTYTTEWSGVVTASDNSGVYFSVKYGSNPGYGHLSTGCNNPSL